jgi:hypothetical protein
MFPLPKDDPEHSFINMDDGNYKYVVNNVAYWFNPTSGNSVIEV